MMKMGQLTACKMDKMNNYNISDIDKTNLNMNVISYIRQDMCDISKRNTYKVKSVIHLRQMGCLYNIYKYIHESADK